MTHKYIAVIHKDADSDFGVSFPDLPGCVTAGSTMDEARDMAADALAGHLAVLAETGADIPEPSGMEVMLGEDFRDGVAILVEAPSEAERRIRVNVSFGERDLEMIDATAEQYGMTRSGFLVHAARALADEAEQVLLRA